MQWCNTLAGVLNTGGTSGGKKIQLWNVFNIQFNRCSSGSRINGNVERLSSLSLEPFNLALNLLEFEFSLQLMEEFSLALEFSLNGLVII